ncbi:hypothetical protein GKE62_00990 [Novosphingobium sp. Gsoil 351]|nr:hypothetical protein GKE62_00990 [Novosphingobium sp. Gsoil 351]
MEPNGAIEVAQTSNETGAQALARKLLQPTLKNAAAASAFTAKMMGNELELPGIGDYADFVQSEARKAADGELAMASRMLAAQAIALDSMFAELARRTANNMGEYINAAERYGRLALKAQGNCRATLESLAKLHQPREQTVKHVHVNEGGQAVVADHIHQHTGGRENAKSNGQPHALESMGDASGQPLRSANAEREAVPVASDA